MEYPNQLTEFDQLINPVDTLISLIYKRELKFAILEFFQKYGEASLSNKGALEEMDITIKTFVSRTLASISKKYRKKLRLVLTDDGIIYYIYSNFYVLMITELEERIDSMPPKQ